MSYFNEAYYMQSKVSQLIKENFPSPDGGTWTVSKLEAVLQSQGLTPQQHYELYGIGENLNPNPYFNQHEYLQAKANQLNSHKMENPYGNRAWTVEDVLEAIKDNGMTAAEHYERYGAFEKDADGNFINPSNAFDANAYYSAKLLQTRTSGETVNGKTGSAISLNDIVQAMQDSNLSPTAHYMEYGANEANTFKIPMVQTVPMDSRVENDPAREDSGETVPGNYNQPTPPPAKSTPKAVTKPADMGNLADDAISPPVVNPDANLPVPGDTGYQSPPANIVDTNDTPVIPPSTTGSGGVTDNWIVTKPDGSGTVIDSDGTTIGTLPPGAIDDDGNITKPVYPVYPVEPVYPVTAAATAGTDSLTFHDGVADSFTTAFGRAGTPGMAEVQKIDLADVTADVEYELTIGQTTVTATPNAANIDSLVTALNDALKTAQVTATVAKVDDGLTITFADNGAQAKATLTENGASVGTQSTKTPGVPAAQEMQKIAIQGSDLGAGDYTLTLNGQTVTVTLTDADLSLEKLAAALNTKIGGNADFPLSVSADNNGLTFQWNDSKAIDHLITLTPPNALTFTATESTKGTLARGYEFTLSIKDVTAGTYLLDLDEAGGNNATKLVFADDALESILSAINDAGIGVTAAQIPGNSEDITLRFTATDLSTKPVVSLVREGLAADATEATRGDAGDAAFAKLSFNGVAVSAGSTYTLVVTADGATVELSAVAPSADLAALITALQEDEDYANAGFKIETNMTSNAILINYTEPGEKNSLTASIQKDSDTPIQEDSYLLGSNGQPEVQKVDLSSINLQANTTYTLTVKHPNPDPDPNSTDGKDFTITMTTGNTAPANAEALLACATGKDIDTDVYSVAANGNDLIITYKAWGNVTGEATLTSPDGAAVVGELSKEQIRVAVAEVQSFDYPVASLTTDDYTFKLDNRDYKVTPEAATVQGLQDAWNKLTDKPAVSFGEGTDGMLTVTFDVTDGDMSPMSMKAPPQTITASETISGAAGTAEVQMFTAIDGLADGDTLVLSNGTHEYLVTVKGYGGDGLKTALDDHATLKNDLKLDSIEAVAESVTFNFRMEAGDAAQLKLTREPKDPITATTTTPGVADVPGFNSLSTLANMDTIDGFCFGEDTIQVGAAITELVKDSLSGITAQDFADKTGAGEGLVGANEAGLFSYNNDYYLLVNNGDAAFDADVDIVIKLTGVTAAEATAATVADIFG